MKNISIFCVNYGSYEELSNYLCSIEQAINSVRGIAHIDVFIADNTETNIKTINDNYNINIKIFYYHKNYGYFGAINHMMKTVYMKDYDYIIISNVDITVDNNIFTELLKQQHNNIGWIAPQIYSKVETRDRNPKILERYSLRKLKILKLFYKYPLLNFIYTTTVYKGKKYKKNNIEHTMIYGGHGSFIILTKQYFENCGIIDYPIFLFGEELYLAEKCRQHGLTVRYEPSIKVIDNEHTSTRKMKSAFYNKCNFEAIDYIIRTFY